MLSWLVRGPLQETMRIIPRTDAIDQALRLPVLFDGTRIHAGLIVAVLAVVVVALVVMRGRFGYRLAVVGSNDHAAQYAGISPSRWPDWPAPSRWPDCTAVSRKGSHRASASPR